MHIRTSTPPVKSVFYSISKLKFAFILGHIFKAFNNYQIFQKYILFLRHWRNGRVVECGGLENRCPFARTGGSNPSFSADLNQSRRQPGFLFEEGC